MVKLYPTKRENTWTAWQEPFNDLIGPVYLGKIFYSEGKWSLNVDDVGHFTEYTEEVLEELIKEIRVVVQKQLAVGV